MDNYKEKPLDEKINQMKEDYNSEWWRPSKIDNFDLKNKLLRVGCRPLKRKYLKCKQNMEDLEQHKNCTQMYSELNKCYELLHLVYYSSKKEEVIKNKPGIGGDNNII